MATHSDLAATSHAPPPGKNARLVEYDEFIEAQLRKTRGHVRSVDLACDLMVLAAGTVGFFLQAGVVDHWIIPGGLGFWGRWLLLSGFVAGATWFLARHVLPLLFRRINPLYAAYTIERSRPSLKNALVNFLMFRANPVGLTDPVYQAIEEQAATNLAKAHVDAAVDRSKLIRMGYVLVAILFVSALYAVLSPKNLFTTIGRVAMPWAQIDAPTRTVIQEIEPGDVQAFRGQQVTVKARIEGLPADGKVMVLYSSNDGQIVDSAVEMTLPPDGYQHTCVLPAGDASLQQSLRYRILAGDAETRPFRVVVVAAPTIVVEAVEYKYPSYTGLLAQRVEHQGDVKAIEGTQITINAVANEDIQSAYIDFDCDTKIDQRMQADGTQAQATFTAALMPDRQSPEHGSYQLVFKNDAGQQNPQPVRHQIEVTRDLPPEIQFLSPKKDEIDLPLNGAIDLEIVANDPDFALRAVKLSAARGDEPLVDNMLLHESWRGQFVKKFRFEPRKLGLKAGDKIAYSAMAEDNKDPQPNRTETAKRQIRIVSPSNRPPDRDQVAKDDRAKGDDAQPGADGKSGGDQGHDEDAANEPTPDEQKKPGQPRDENNGDGEQRAGEKGNGEQEQPTDEGEQPADKSGGEGGQQGNSPDKSSDASGKQSDGGGDKQGGDDRAEGVPNDGSNDRDAIERILEHRDQQQKSDPGSDGQPGDKQDGQQSRKQPQGKEQNGKAQQGDEQQGDEQKGPGQGKGQGGQSNKSPGKSQSKDQAGQDKKSGGQQGGDDPRAEKSGSEKRPSEKQPSKNQDGDKQGGDPDKSQGKQGANGDQNQKQKGDQRGQDSREGKKKQGGDPSSSEQSKSDARGKSPPDKSEKPDKSSKSGKGQDGGQQPNDSNSKPGADDKAGDASQGKDSSKSKGKPTGKPAGDDVPVTEDEGQGQQGKASKSSKSNGKQGNEKTQRGENKDGASGDNARPGDDAKAQEDASGEPKSGQGAPSKGDPKSKSNSPAPRDKEQPDSNGGDAEKEKGPSGAGQSGQDNKGSPSPQGKNQPRDKSQSQSPDKGEQKPSTAQSPSTSERESNSEGQDDGDRSGGGKKGGGQKANKSGTGGAGQNTPSDEGAGQSDEAGQGETSGRPGKDQQSNDKTGKSGANQGAGSETAPAGDEGQSGEGAPDDGAPSGKQSGDPAGGNQPGQPGSGAANQPTGGRPDAAPSKDQVWKPGEDAADKANLEYARKATDLAITHLKDELKKEKTDPELLKRLNWSKADLEKFVKRWEQMRGQADAPGDKGAPARRELDDALRSLGLRPRATSLKGDAARGDKSQGYKESRRTSPPPEYAEQYKAYTQGTAKGVR